jgi:hypothetical protein
MLYNIRGGNMALRLRKKIKYDLVIYTCLIGALVLIGLSAKEYLNNTSYSIKEILFPKEQVVVVPEPPEFKKINKEQLLNNYINELLDQIKTDDVLTYEILRSWNDYKIINIKYDKEILNNYHSYLVEIEIKNENAILPTKKNKDKSNDKKSVIELRMNVLKDPETNETIVKKVDIPNNS